MHGLADQLVGKAEPGPVADEEPSGHGRLDRREQRLDRGSRQRCQLVDGARAEHGGEADHLDGGRGESGEPAADPLGERVGERGSLHLDDPVAMDEAAFLHEPGQQLGDVEGVAAGVGHP